MFVFAEINANAAHKIKNIVANQAVARVKKLPAAAPVYAPPNIDDADEPDMPEPSDFCNKINPIIKTATITNKTNKIENIFFPLLYLCADFIPTYVKLQEFSTILLRQPNWPLF